MEDKEVIWQLTKQDFKEVANKVISWDGLTLTEKEIDKMLEDVMSHFKFHGWDREIQYAVELALGNHLITEKEK